MNQFVQNFLSCVSAKNCFNWFTVWKVITKIRRVNFLLRHSVHTLCLKKNIPDILSHNSRKHWRIFRIFGRNVTEKASNHMLLHFPPHLINASTLPCETENTEIVSFHVNVSCWFANRHTSHVGIITKSLLRLLFIDETIGYVHQTRST